MSTVAFIRRMMEAGFSADDALRAAEAFEATTAELPAPVSKAALRTRKWRENRHQPSPTVTGDASDVRDASDEKVSPTPPSKNTPSSPPKGGSSPPSPLIAEIWEAANPISRGRSGRPATGRAVQAALAKGATPEALLASVRHHCRTAGDHPKGLHRIIEAELWRDHAPKPEPPPGAVDDRIEAGRRLHFAKTGEWRSDWGPRPSPPHKEAA